MPAGWAGSQLSRGDIVLKFILDSLDGLDENQAAMYKKTDDGKFQLQVDGLEDVSGLKAQRDSLLNEKKEAQRKADEAAEAARIAREEAARKSGDTEALEKSWQEKLTKREAELQSKIDALNGSINGMTVEATAKQLATELAVDGSADILFPHIKARLAAEQRDGQFITAVRDADGKPSAASLDDLKTEFAGNKAFAPIIRASNASGGGANAGNTGGGGANTGNMGGGKSERTEAIRAKYPELAE